MRSDEIIGRVQSVTDMTRSVIAADIFGISLSNLGNRLREDRLDFYKLFGWALGHNINLHWLVTGDGEAFCAHDELDDATLEQSIGGTNDLGSETGQIVKALVDTNKMLVERVTALEAELEGYRKTSSPPDEEADESLLGTGSRKRSSSR